MADQTAWLFPLNGLDLYIGSKVNGLDSLKITNKHKTGVNNQYFENNLIIIILSKVFMKFEPTVLRNDLNKYNKT